MAREAPSSSTCTARAAIKEADPSRAIIAIVDRKNARKLKALLKSESGWFTCKPECMTPFPTAVQAVHTPRSEYWN